MAGSKHSSAGNETLYDRTIRWLKNRPMVVVPLIVFAITIGTDKFMDSIERITERLRNKGESLESITNPSTISAPAVPTDISGQQQDQRLDRTGTAPEVIKPDSSSEQQRMMISVGNNGQVQLRSALRGITPFFGKNHYAVVTPPNGTDWVNPVSVDVNGRLRGDPQFGEESIGIGDTFIVRVLVTDSSLYAGKLAVVPGDAIFSDPITVTRER